MINTSNSYDGNRDLCFYLMYMKGELYQFMYQGYYLLKMESVISLLDNLRLFNQLT